MNRLKAVCVGAGYFSQFHYEAWSRIAEVEIAAVCDLDRKKAQSVAERYAIKHIYTDMQEALSTEQPDFVDIITPPSTHLELCSQAVAQGINIICQKPVAPSFEEATQLAEIVSDSAVRFMVHENWRFNPWYREAKRLIDKGLLGKRIHSLSFRSRMGDGWGENAYLDRQPYFRDYERLLIYETGVHFIDTFRFLLGEVRRVYCATRKLNPVIAGEDSCLLLLEFEGGPIAVWDANRFNESTSLDPRYTFGQMRIDGSSGSLCLEEDAKLTLKMLGEPEVEHPYEHRAQGFSGDCVYHTQRHFVDQILAKSAFETGLRDYLRTLAVQETAYESAHTGQALEVDYSRCNA